MIYKTIMRACGTKIGSLLLMQGFGCSRLIVLSHCILVIDLSHLHIRMGYLGIVFMEPRKLKSYIVLWNTSRSGESHQRLKQVNLISIIRK